MRAAFLIAFFQFIFLSGFSCDCDPLTKLDTINCPYQLIFRGTVTDTLSKGEEGIAVFACTRLFLGDHKDTFRIKFDNASSCLMSFSPGEEWLIYAMTDIFKRSEVHFCGHSRKFISADKNQDYNYQVRGITFEEEAEFLARTFSANSENDPEPVFAERELEHPERGTAIWYILAAAPILLLLWWLLKKYLK